MPTPVSVTYARPALHDSGMNDCALRSDMTRPRAELARVLRLKLTKRVLTHPAEDTPAAPPRWAIRATSREFVVGEPPFRCVRRFQMTRSTCSKTSASGGLTSTMTEFSTRSARARK